MWVVDRLRHLEQDDVGGQTTNALAQVVGQPRGGEKVEGVLTVGQFVLDDAGDGGVVGKTNDPCHRSFLNFNCASILYNTYCRLKVTLSAQSVKSFYVAL